MSTKKADKNMHTLPKEICCDIIHSPVITEKASVIASGNQYAFNVAKYATKPTVKTAIETLFDVKVKAVNMLNRKGKVKRFRGNIGQRSDQKKAIVTLAEGQSIDFTAKIS